MTDWQSFKRVKDFRLCGIILLSISLFQDLENLSYVEFGSFTLSNAQTALFNSNFLFYSMIIRSSNTGKIDL